MDGLLQLEYEEFQHCEGAGATDEETVGGEGKNDPHNGDNA